MNSEDKKQMLEILTSSFLNDILRGESSATLNMMKEIEKRKTLEVECEEWVDDGG